MKVLVREYDKKPTFMNDGTDKTLPENRGKRCQCCGQVIKK